MSDDENAELAISEVTKRLEAAGISLELRS